LKFWSIFLYGINLDQKLENARDTAGVKIYAEHCHKKKILTKKNFFDEKKIFDEEKKIV